MSRRASKDGMIPVRVRVRGRTSAQRFDSFMRLGDVADRITPEELAGRRSGLCRAAQVPALRTLARADPVLTRHGHRWGPIGSIGFELATNVPAANATSDLDLLLRMENVLDRAMPASCSWNSLRSPR